MIVWRTPEGVRAVDALPAPDAAEDPARTALRIRADPGAFALWLPVPEERALDARVPALLPAEAADRLEQFSHPERRRQSLWARAAALLCLRAFPSLTYHEDPPFGPVLSGSGGERFFVTLAHTRGAAAALLSRSPAGIDLEAHRPLKNPEAVLGWTFGEEAARAACRGPGAEKHFFALWGLHECVVKMNRTREGEEALFRLQLRPEGEENRWRARITGGVAEPAATLFALPRGWLTVLAPAGKSVHLSMLNPERLVEYLEQLRL